MLEIDIGGGRKIQLDFPGFKPQIVLIGFAVVGVLVGVLTSIYTIKPEEVGVVLLN